MKKRLYCIKDAKGQLLLNTAKKNRSECVCLFAETLSTNWKDLLNNGYRCVVLKVNEEKK